MLVEDDPALNDVLSYNLKKAGYEVVSILAGDEAVRRLPTEQPDLLLLDVMLPGADGWEVCGSLEKSTPPTTVPTVFFTSRGTREDFDKARGFRNFAGYFVKPYNTVDVLRHIEKLLGAEA
jgi:DNA-binding response OmpR family regulator